jgi:hypothetical protein
VSSRRQYDSVRRARVARSVDFGNEPRLRGSNKIDRMVETRLGEDNASDTSVGARLTCASAKARRAIVRMLSVEMDRGGVGESTAEPELSAHWRCAALSPCSLFARSAPTPSLRVH